MWSRREVQLLFSGGHPFLPVTVARLQQLASYGPPASASDLFVHVSRPSPRPVLIPLTLSPPSQHFWLSLQELSERDLRSFLRGLFPARPAPDPPAQSAASETFLAEWQGDLRFLSAQLAEAADFRLLVCLRPPPEDPAASCDGLEIELDGPARTVRLPNFSSLAVMADKLRGLVARLQLSGL